MRNKITAYSLFFCPNLGQLTPASSHAPVGVRRDDAPAESRSLRFNPRTRRGATRRYHVSFEFHGVSIHAPVWVRLLPYCQFFPYILFQSTHPFGCDVRSPCYPRAKHCFNPRTRLGATMICYDYPPPSLVSIHAPVWVRRATFIFLFPIISFQSTHPFGCDSENFIFSLLSFISMYLSSHCRALFGSD